VASITTRSEHERYSVSAAEPSAHVEPAGTPAPGSWLPGVVCVHLAGQIGQSLWLSVLKSNSAFLPGFHPEPAEQHAIRRRIAGMMFEPRPLEPLRQDIIA